MKKFLSAILVAALMVCTLAPIASAEIETITLPTTSGEFVLLEAEDYVNDFIVDGKQQSVATSDKTYVKEASYVATETAQLSGGVGLYSGSFGNSTVTLTFPISVEKDTVFEMECSAGYGGHLNQNYWALDGGLIFYTATDSGFGTGTGYYLTDNANYPTGIYTCEFLIPAGTHELAYVMPKRPTMGGAFVLDYAKLTATDGKVPTISWEEEATTSVVVNGKVAAITFTDAAVETIEDTVTPMNKYRIDIYPKNGSAGKVMSYTFNAYTGDRVGEDGNVLTRPTAYTAHVPLKNIMQGDFYAEIYPIGVAYPSMQGEPIISETFTVTEDAPGYANRYEAEEYWTFETDPIPVVESDYASGGKLLASIQHKVWTSSQNVISNKTADYWKDTYDVSFEVNLPADGTYDIETVMGMNKDGYTDVITVSIDGDQIYTNAVSGSSEDLSINGSYPWSYTYACRYLKTIALTGGKHTVTFAMTRPTVQDQPHLFMVDYIQFTPAKPALSQNHSTILEMEDYANSFIAFDELGNTIPVDPSTGVSGNTSGGKFITKDTTFKFNGESKSVPVKADIPVTVSESGLYNFEVIDSTAGCDGLLYLSDGIQMFTPIEKFSSGVNLAKNGSGIDGFDEVRTNFGIYYNIKWHNARLSNGMVYLPAGEYTLTVQFNGRTIGPGMSGMAFCIDNVKVTPAAAPVANIAEEGTTFIEAEEYQDFYLKDKSSFLKADITENAKAHNGKLAGVTEKPMELGHYVTIPVTAEKAGWYDMGSVMSISNDGWTSLVTISVNGEPVIVGEKANAVENLSKTDNVVDYLNSSYLMHRFSERVYLEEGKNEIEIHAAPRTEKTDAEKTADEAAIAAGGNAGYYRVGYYIDYVSFAPVADSMVMNDTSVSGTVVLADGAEGKLIVAAYNGKEMVGTAMYDATGEAIKDIAFTCSKAPDNVKVFLWSDMNSLAPVVAPKIFNK